MTPVGHIAFAWLTARNRVDDRSLPFVAMAGALVPDIIDKSLKFAGVYPWGRTIGHSVIVWFIIANLVGLAAATVMSSRWPRWFVFGAFTHLLADFVDDIVAGFQWTSYAQESWMLWPLSNPDVWNWKVTPLLPSFRVVTWLEIVVVAVTFFYVYRSRTNPGPKSEDIAGD